MIDNKRIVCIIPARGGSRGLPGKNIKMFDNKPMIAHGIIKALNIDLIDYVMVTTDSEKIAEIAKQYGADIPFLRDKKLAQSNSPFTPVIVDAIEKIKSKKGKFDYAVILQANSPLTKIEDIKKAIYKLHNEKLDVVFSITENSHPPLWTIKLENEKPMFAFFNDNGEEISNRQSVEITYRSTGAIYVVNIDYLLSHQKTARLALPAINQNSGVIITDPKYSIDIDNEIDFMLAEVILQKIKEENEK